MSSFTENQSYIERFGSETLQALSSYIYDYTITDRVADFLISCFLFCAFFGILLFTIRLVRVGSYKTVADYYLALKQDAIVSFITVLFFMSIYVCYTLIADKPTNIQQDRIAKNITLLGSMPPKIDFTQFAACVVSGKTEVDCFLDTQTKESLDERLKNVKSFKEEKERQDNIDNYLKSLGVNDK